METQQSIEWNSPENVAKWKFIEEGSLIMPNSESNVISIPKITKREEILQAAIQCVTKDRQTTHGKPENSFADIAHLWSWYKEIEFTPYDAAVMMALMKTARVKGNAEHDDSKIDLCGYMSIAAELKPKLP